ncbi:MAG TPA: amidohydrolase family protein [Kribbella sp.]|nr:amidohydrolase family protein [Kribbella sp.]
MLAIDFVFGAEKLGADLFALREQTRTRHHRPDFAKVFLDGIPPTYTAAFLDPYAPSAEHGPCFRGEVVMDGRTLENRLRLADGEGLGVKVHCTGSAAVRQVLDAVEAVRARGVSANVHVAHGQYVADEDVPRFASLDVVAEISPPLWFPCDIVDVMRSILPASWSTPTARVRTGRWPPIRIRGPRSAASSRGRTGTARTPERCGPNRRSRCAKHWKLIRQAAPPHSVSRPRSARWKRASRRISPFSTGTRSPSSLSTS